MNGTNTKKVLCETVHGTSRSHWVWSGQTFFFCVLIYTHMRTHLTHSTFSTINSLHFAMAKFDSITMNLIQLWKIGGIFPLFIKKKNYLSELAELGGSNCCFFTDADIINHWNQTMKTFKSTDRHVFSVDTWFISSFLLSIQKGAIEKRTTWHFHSKHSSILLFLFCFVAKHRGWKMSILISACVSVSTTHTITGKFTVSHIWSRIATAYNNNARFFLDIICQRLTWANLPIPNFIWTKRV